MIDGVLCHTRAEMVIRSFWTFYRCEEGYEEAAAKVIDTECKCLLQNLRREARPQAVRDYYATRGIKKDKPSCRGKFLKKEQYMKVPPRWCADKMDCWEALVDEWCTCQWRAVHDNAKDRRAQMVGVPHDQGNANLFQFGRNWAHHNNMEVPEVYNLYGMAHTASYKKFLIFVLLIGKIFEEETIVEGETIRSSRWPCTSSYVNPVNFLPDKNSHERRDSPSSAADSSAKNDSPLW
ncbi:hypothetical protein ZWY2020_038322 [Hordeum vulgare]|nr:hypothetical protein ZWY2020_038322 [Hordeum vulgare]